MNKPITEKDCEHYAQLFDTSIMDMLPKFVEKYGDSKFDATRRTLIEPIVMYQMGRTQIFPPYKYPLFLNPQHWVTRYLLTEVQYKEMIEFETKHTRHNGVTHHDERGTIAKWKIYLK